LHFLETLPAGLPRRQAGCRRHGRQVFRKIKIINSYNEFLQRNWIMTDGGYEIRSENLAQADNHCLPAKHAIKFC